MRLRLTAVTLAWWIAALAAAQPIHSDEPQNSDATALGDACLADVCFIDRRTGWAVGERGVVWHTRDAGATWRLQNSGVVCRLNSVCFIDAERGWAVGGAARPYSTDTEAVVIHTEDGGQTWAKLPQPMLPRLSRVQFFSPQDGIAIGASASTHLSGVFVTRDGGRSWQSLPTDQTSDWVAGDFLDPDTGAVAGGSGRFATLIRRQVLHSPLASDSPRMLHALRLAAPTGGWLVGDGGLVMSTNDLGRSWQMPTGGLPSEVFGQFDFHAVAVEGPRVWVAGSPGTRVFHSPDAGQTWHAQMTGLNIPWRGLTFVDDTHGWAVGELGSILTTRDGGRTWQLQRAGGERAALLGIFAGGDDVPLELVVEQAGVEGYLTALRFLRDGASVDPPSGVAAARGKARTREAMILAGATAADTAWRFPVPPDDLALGPAELLAALNRANDGRAVHELERQLVRELRTWRPDVVVTQHAPSDQDPPIAALVEQFVLRAVEAAGDPTQFVELASDVGLQPWSVKKVYGVLPPGSRGDESIATDRFSARIGCSLADRAAPAQHLLATLAHSPPTLDTIGLVLLVNHVSDGDGPRGMFSGISLAPGGGARRPSATEIAGDVDTLRRMALQRRHLRELLERSEGNAAWIAQIERMIAGLPAQSGGELLFQLAAGYRETGRLDLAADTYYLLARRYPDHPLADQSLVWLVQFYASAEAAHRSNGPRLHDMRPGATNPSSDAANVRPASAEAPPGANLQPLPSLTPDDRLRRAAQLGEYLEATRPALYADPTARFPLVAAQRQLGFANPAKRYYLTLGKLPERDPWRLCAETEEWLSKPADAPPPKVLGHCRIASERPHLDGQLDEPFWVDADRLRLKGDDADATGEVRLCYDDVFLYVAVRCRESAGGDYRTDERPRSRDADLSAHDRVSLRFDVDRDFTTSFELVVDHRGWTLEKCWSDASWNPTWFVAASKNDGSAHNGGEMSGTGGNAETEVGAWTVEAAIPLAALVADRPAARSVWAVAIRRTIPRVGYRSWPGPTKHSDSPDEFGLLIFE